MKKQSIGKGVGITVIGKLAFSQSALANECVSEDLNVQLLGSETIFSQVAESSGDGKAEGQADSEAILYAKNLEAGSAIGIEITGLNAGAESDIYVAFSTVASAESEIGELGCSGSFALDLETLQILAGVRVKLPEPFFPFPETALGGATLEYDGLKNETVELVVNLNQFLEDPSLEGDEIFLQALAVPAGTLDLTAGSVSGLAKLSINRTDEPSGEGKATGDDSGGDSGGKT